MKNKKFFSLLFVLTTMHTCAIAPRGEQLAVATTRDYVRLPEDLLAIVQSSLSEQTKLQEHTFIFGDETLPLFTQFPQLHQELPHVTLGSFPTTVHKLEHFGAAIGIENMYIKCDNLSGGVSETGQPLFGGNKVRKLEFLLADALYNDTQSVVTFGGSGSNHALATMTYAQQLDLKGIAVLSPQQPSEIVKRNLCLDFHHNAQLHLCNNREIRNLCIAYTMLREKQLNGVLPYIIPVGGSCPTGTVGFVNAVFELKQQIGDGLLPEPDYIYVTLGSMGTVAGLLVGVKAARLTSKIVAVAVSNNPTHEKAIQLAHKTNQFLHEADPSFPLFTWEEDDLIVLRNFIGKGYGIFTQEGIDAIDLIQKTENITLDGVYTGKCLAGLAAQAPQHKDDVVLFWNTFCGDDFAQVVDTVDYTELPNCFHRYFEL